jgi:uncharacterized protein
MFLRFSSNSLFVFSFLLLLCSCMPLQYYQEIAPAKQMIASHNYQDAKKFLENNKFLHKKRNSFLYDVEMGRIHQLLGEYDSSNAYFNKADALLGDWKHIRDRDVRGNTVFEENGFASVSGGAGGLVEPRLMEYRSSDFEKVLIHYFKALNYFYLNKHEDALVEARRLDLLLKNLNDKHKNNNQQDYLTDGSALVLIGLIYETNKDYNNAFIAYRNAYEVFNKNSSFALFGYTPPLQLKYDILKSAYLSGFADEVTYYEKEFNTKFTYQDNKNGDLILFWENGFAPVKTERNIYTVTLGQRICIPEYQVMRGAYNYCMVRADSVLTFFPETLKDINYLATNLENQRFIREANSASADITTIGAIARDIMNAQ